MNTAAVAAAAAAAAAAWLALRCEARLTLRRTHHTLSRTTAYKTPGKAIRNVVAAGQANVLCKKRVGILLYLYTLANIYIYIYYLYYYFSQTILYHYITI